MIFVFIFLTPLIFTLAKLKAPKLKKRSYVGKHRNNSRETHPTLEKYALVWDMYTELLQKRLVDKAAEDDMMGVYKSPKEVRHDRRKNLWRQANST